MIVASVILSALLLTVVLRLDCILVKLSELAERSIALVEQVATPVVAEPPSEFTQAFMRPERAQAFIAFLGADYITDEIVRDQTVVRFRRRSANAYEDFWAHCREGK